MTEYTSQFFDNEATEDNAHSEDEEIAVIKPKRKRVKKDKVEAPVAGLEPKKVEEEKEANVFTKPTVSDEWHPICWCGIDCNKYDKNDSRDYAVFSCANSKFVDETQAYGGGCNFFLKSTELTTSKCHCGFPVKKFTSKDKTAVFQTCPYLFRPKTSKVTHCRTYRKSMNKKK